MVGLDDLRGLFQTMVLSFQMGKVETSLQVHQYLYFSLFSVREKEKFSLLHRFISLYI